MAKKNTSTTAAAKAAKKAKALQKVERKEKKKVLKEKGVLANSSNSNANQGKGKGKGKGKGGGGKKGGNESDSDDDLEGILEKMREEWERAHAVTEELVEGPPSKRANATLTPCPNGNHIWSIGGEWFSEDKRAYFYNDVFRYTPEKDEWRKFVSPTCPGPRSAHAVAATPAGGGKLFLFGGEFSSLHQNTFHHYGDFWCFDIQTNSWDRIETKVRPSARSGHRMTMWKHFVVLFGGFYDPGITTRYLNDLWIFDTQEYSWRQVEFKETELRPSPRSGFSFLPCAEGIILHGGYCKQYQKGQRPVGVMLEDTWLLKLSLPENPTAGPPSNSAAAPSSAKSKSAASTSKAKTASGPTLLAKWERRKRPSDAFAPSLRSGCTMTLWPARNMGILFGGVTDEDTNEETLDSVFWNDLYGYQLTGKGKWVSLGLKQPKAKGGAKKKKKVKERKGAGDDDDDDDADEDLKDHFVPPPRPAGDTKSPTDDPNLTVPLPRYNTMLAVLRNALYIYGGIFERGSQEYTLDDFHMIQLDKLERYNCLNALSFEIPNEAEVESSSSEDDDDEDDDDDDDTDACDTDGEYGGEDEDGTETLVGESVKGGDEDASISDAEDGEEGEAHLNLPRKIDRKQKKAEKKEKRSLGVLLEGTEPEQPKVDSPGQQEQQDDDEDALRKQASTFMGTSKDTTRSEEDVFSTPLPGETLTMFYARSRNHWTQKAQNMPGNVDNRGKELRRVAFALAKERYDSYKPLLAEVEKILAEAGLNEEEMRRGAAQASAPGLGGALQSRNRR